MSMLNRPANSTDVGEMVATTKDYASAQKMVSKLIAGEVPARDIAIVGQNVRTVERVTGRLGYAAAARSGAINGVLIGLFLSAVLVLGNPEVPIQLFVGMVFIGVAIGMILSLVTYAIVRRRRDFASVTQFAADHYEVTVMAASVAKAREVLGAVRPATVRPTVNMEEPPRYGERVLPGAGAGAGAGAGPGAGAGAQLDPDSTSASDSAAQSEGDAVVPPRPADPAPRYGERATDASATGIDAEVADSDTSGADDVPSDNQSSSRPSDSATDESRG